MDKESFSLMEKVEKITRTKKVSTRLTRENLHKLPAQAAGSQTSLKGNAIAEM